MVNFIGLSLVITSHCVLDIYDMPFDNTNCTTIIITEKSTKRKSKQAQNGWAERTQK